MAESVESLFSLKGKTALITGGYKSIGFAITEVLAAAGADVVIAARKVEACIEAARRIKGEYGVDALGLGLDIRNTSQVDDAIGSIVQKYGKLDIVVNNAGVEGSLKPFVKMTDEEVDNVMDLNFGGTFKVCRAAARVMIGQKSGKIINVSSIAGKKALYVMAEYCASKAAVTQFTRVIALELARYGIQANTLCPGFFYTDMTASEFARPEVEKVTVSKIPVGYIAQVHDLKTAALYLATCPNYVTGTEVYVDGGCSI